MENARLAKDNAKLTTDYQNVEKKFREEAAKIKDMDDKMRILEKKLEAAGLQSSSGSKKERRPTQMATIRYRPTLKNPFCQLSEKSEFFFDLFEARLRRERAILQWLVIWARD